MILIFEILHDNYGIKPVVTKNMKSHFQMFREKKHNPKSTFSILFNNTEAKRHKNIKIAFLNILLNEMFDQNKFLNFHPTKRYTKPHS